jgi:hypothetical protein
MIPDLATIRLNYTDARDGHESPDPQLVALVERYALLLVLRDAVTALLPDLSSAEDESCTVCGEPLEHTEDCPVWPLILAYRKVSPRRVEGRPAGQRIAEKPTPEAREVLGLDGATTVPDETIALRAIDIYAGGPC